MLASAWCALLLEVVVSAGAGAPLLLPLPGCCQLRPRRARTHLGKAGKLLAFAVPADFGGVAPIKLDTGASRPVAQSVAMQYQRARHADGSSLEEARKKCKMATAADFRLFPRRRSLGM